MRRKAYRKFTYKAMFNLFALLKLLVLLLEIFLPRRDSLGPFQRKSGVSYELSLFGRNLDESQRLEGHSEKV